MSDNTPTPDTLTLRDHSGRCEHGALYNCLTDSNCPGGREIVLTREVLGPYSPINAYEIWWVEVEHEAT